MYKTRIRILFLAVAIILATTFTGCAANGSPQTPQPSPPPGSTSPTQQTVSPDQSPPDQSPADQTPPDQTPSDQNLPDPPPPDTGGGTYVFTDSCGREVELPTNIERVAPSGSLSQIVLYTLCPDKLAGLSVAFGDAHIQFVADKYLSLPVFGNFYLDTLNLESVMLAAPQVIIDIGETKPSANDDLDGLQERTGIPTIFIQMDMNSIPAAYDTLGGITGETAQAQRLIEYVNQTLSDTAQKLSTIPESERVRLYYGQDDGLTATVGGTVHSEIIDIAGGYNVTEVEESVRGGVSVISMEQLMLWNPDVVLFAPGSIYDTVATQSEWQEISAVKTGKYYEIPFGPYNWMGRPPSVNRILGVKWLSNLLYPDLFPYDMLAETTEFYKLFYHCDVTDAQISALLNNSTFK